MLDTPGILWPKFDDEDVAYRLALTGAIKDDILPIDEIVIYGFRFLSIGIKRGCLLPGKHIDYERVNDLFLFDFRHEKFGKIILDRVSDYV